MSRSRSRPGRVVLCAIAAGLVSVGAAAAQQTGTPPCFAPVPGGRLEFEVRGQGEPVLLIHGVAIADLLHPLADELALAHYRVISYHRRGYGGSSPTGDWFSVEQDAADASALLQYLGIAQAHIVAHSAGAIVAIQLAADFPGQVRSLSLLDPPLQFARAVTLQPREGGADAVEAFLLGKGKPDFRKRLDSTLPGALGQARRDARRFNLVEWTALGRWEFDAVKAHGITAPVLYVSEERSAAVDTAEAWWPAMEFVELDGETHMFPFEAPVETAGIIAGFLSRHRM